ncbi:DUF1236 domain-containing protein [Mesorhizobium sp. YR577]|uniref:DUF1236 domain-containing protein n=1 Tax=Mesorhizobium sp. YR577 TaxID=1884373 RepID=UPI0008F3D86B|nr:DUF1236 domain-containing protein [Mesorhizobium sp. YR577]SFU21296.1 Protein of unknown function [Mesorhizobium sp. YR577]
MKAQLLVAGLLIAPSTGASFAQDVLLGPAQETIIREYVVRDRVVPIEPLPDVDFSVGTVLPDTVELHTIEQPDLDGGYSYVVVGERTVVVEPGTRRIIHIME